MALNTIQSSIGGVLAGMAAGLLLQRDGPRYNIGHICVSVVASLVASAANCSVVTPLESLLIGAIAALVALGTKPLLEV